MKGLARFLGLAVAAALLLTHPAPAGAQQLCGFCSDELVEGVWVHKFTSSGAVMACGREGCHYVWSGFGLCTSFHGACTYASNEAMKAAELAANSSDAPKLQAVLKKHHDFLKLDASRSSLLVLACGGSVARRIPVSPAVAARLAHQRAPRPATTTAALPEN